MDIIIYSSFILGFSCIVFLIGLWKFLNWGWFTPWKLEKKLKEQGVIGIPYKSPFPNFKITKTTEKVDNPKPMNLYDDDLTIRIMRLNLEWFKDCGKCFVNWHGPTPQFIVMDGELIKEVMQKYYQFLKVPHNPLGKLLMKGISSLEREEWLKHRKIISPAFHIEKVKLMVPAFYKSVSEILTKWKEIVSSKGSAQIDVWPYLQRLTGDVISRTAFGSNYEEGKEIFELQKEQAQYFVKVTEYPYIPGWRFLPTKMHRRMKNISRIVNDKIESIIDARMMAMKAGEACGDDFLGLLLESNSKDKEFGISIQDVIEECKLLYFSGQETTSVLLVWTMFLLGRHPEWQNRARKEVLQHFDKHQIPDHDSLNQLKVVTMILCEVLRLYPPATGVQRIATEETKLGDFTIPKGVTLFLSILSTHHDPEIWGEDAKEFKPERFAGGIPNAAKGRVSFLSFGWGPRICAGQNFAMAEAKMAIALILQRFSFEVSPSYLHLPDSATLTLQPKYGTQLIFHNL